jgi:hypothetical protein
MDISRRSFLKVGLAGLLFGAVNSNPIVKKVVETIETQTLDVLLYLIQTKDGKWRIKGTLCINVPRKKVSSVKYKIETLQPLKVVNHSIANKVKRELWKKYNCYGNCTTTNYLNAYKRGLAAKESGQIQELQKRFLGLGGRSMVNNKVGIFSYSKEEKIRIASLGGKKSAPKMIEWCKQNNHWETISKLQTGVPKSKEVKIKISNKLKGRLLSEETKKKMSESRMGHGWSEETLKKLSQSARKRMKPISQFDLNKNWIKDFNGLAEMYDELKLNKRAVQLVCNNWKNNAQRGSKQCGGYIWKYKN